MLYQERRSFGQSFSSVRQAFLQAEGLPFRDVLSEGEIQQAFEAENACFGGEKGDLYTPAVTLWAFLSQVLHAQRLRSCVAAVSRVIVLCVALGRREIGVHWLAYNLIRKTMAQAALVHGKLPRHLSFAAALVAVATSWDLATSAQPQVLAALAQAQFRVIASHQVADRPDRVEPRAVKRRPKPHRLLRQPRTQARAKLYARPCHRRSPRP